METVDAVVLIVGFIIAAFIANKAVMNRSDEKSARSRAFQEAERTYTSVIDRLKAENKAFINRLYKFEHGAAREIAESADLTEAGVMGLYDNYAPEWIKQFIPRDVAREYAKEPEKLKPLVEWAKKNVKTLKSQEQTAISQGI